MLLRSRLTYVNVQHRTQQLQAIWRRVQLLGLVTHYEDSGLRSTTDSSSDLHNHQTTDLPAEQLLDHFESTWNNGTFPVSMWNLYKQELPTKNKVEGCHNSLNQAVRKSHPNRYELLTVLKEGQAATDRTKPKSCCPAWNSASTNEKEIQRKKQATKDLQESFERGKETLKNT